MGKGWDGLKKPISLPGDHSHPITHYFPGVYGILAFLFAAAIPFYLLHLESENLLRLAWNEALDTRPDFWGPLEYRDILPPIASCLRLILFLCPVLSFAFARAEIKRLKQKAQKRRGVRWAYAAIGLNIFVALVLFILSTAGFFYTKTYDANARYISQKIQVEEMKRFLKGQAFTSDLGKLVDLGNYKKYFPNIQCVFHKISDEEFSVSVYHTKSTSGRVFTVRSPAPIYMASVKGDMNQVKHLIEQGADFNVYYKNPHYHYGKENRWGLCTTPLNCAVRYGHTEIVKLLISHKAQIQPYGYENQSMLRVATHYGHTELVKYLLSLGEGFQVRNEKEPNLVYLAAESGRRELLHLFLDMGIDPNQLTYFQQSPIGIAIEKGHREIVEDLIQRGADPTLGLSAAIIQKDSITISALIKQGADPNSAFFPLHTAAIHNSIEVMELLLTLGAKIDHKHPVGGTVLHFAAGDKSLDMVQFLVSKGADVNAKNYYKETPLFQAARNGKLENVKFLIDSGAEVNAPDRMSSPLHRAAREGHLDVAKFLIKKGANINARDGGGNTPMRLAVSEGHWRIAFLLFHKGAQYK